MKSAIAVLGVNGLTVTDVRGAGNSPERVEWLGGDSALIALPIRSRLEVVASDEMREAIVSAIIENARTGEPGDGKIFIEPVAEAIRVRTGERGELAV